MESLTHDAEDPTVPLTPEPGQSTTAISSLDLPSASERASVLESLAASGSLVAVPRVLLRDTDTNQETSAGPGPVVRVGSPEMPEPAASPGRLQLLGEIARGGMGAILKGRDNDIGRDLAVKVLLEQHSERTDLVQRFIEEAQIAGQLQHPGVVPVYELGQFADRRPFFSMKLVKGRTLADLLADRLDQGPALDLPRFLGIFHQVCQTVAYAHARGVIHRDLKPSNVMVGNFGEVQVMDWGLAKVLPRGGASADDAAGLVDVHETVIATARSTLGLDQSQAGSVLGTPAYMAPEQALGELDTVDERSDVFSLGSILCEILTGQPAFSGRGRGEIMRKAARGDVADAFVRLDACGADLELIALSRACLAAEREDRPRDAGAVAARLASHLAGVQERLRTAEVAHAAESARALEAERTTAFAEARARAERRARRMTTGLAASLLALTTLGGLTFTYILYQRQARAASIERIVVRATTLLDQARAQSEDVTRWRMALEAVQQVEDDPGPIGPDVRAHIDKIKAEARSGLDSAVRDTTLRQKLVDVRASQQDAGPEATDLAYAEAFRAADLDIDTLDAAEAAARIRRRTAPLVVELAAYLDHWGDVRRQAGRPAPKWRKPLEVARAADSDDYRNRLRTLLTTSDPETDPARLKSLATEPGAAELPAPTAVLLSGALERARDRDTAVGLLRQAVIQHPDDVWVNFTLAGTLQKMAPAPRDEAVRYYTAARALRPETAHDLAHLLEETGRGDEAVATFRALAALRPDSRNLACFGSALKARGQANEAVGVLARAVAAARDLIQRNPNDHESHFRLGYALKAQGKLTDAEAEYRAALKLKSNAPVIHDNLGDVLSAQRRHAEAETEYRAALKLDPDYALAHDSLGDALIAQKKLAEAEAEYRAALKLKPDYAVAHNDLGFALYEQKKAADAEAEYRAALKLRPDYTVAQLNLGNALWAQKKHVEAEAEYRAAVKLHPHDVDAHNNLSWALSQQNKHPEAEAEARAALKLKPDDSGAHNNLGFALQGQGKLADAEAEYRTALKLDPDRPAFHDNLAGALFQQRKFAEAEAEARATLKLSPEYATAHNGLGSALYHQNRPAEAEVEFRAALRLQPDDADIHNNLGNALSAQRKLVEAEAEYRAGLKLKRDDAQHHFNFAQALLQQNRPVEAEAEFRVAVKLKPDNAEAHDNLGDALMAQNKPAEAETEYRAALKLNPNFAVAHTDLARALSAQGKHAEVEVEFRRALKFDPDNADFHYNLGNALRAQDKLAGAEAEYRAALQRKPDFPEAHCNLGHLLGRAGRYAEALEEFRRGHELGSRRPGWPYPSAQWVRDCERMVALSARLPAVLKGNDHPTDAADRITFGQLCYDRKLHAAATKLYSQAFHSDPKLADDRQAGHMYNAACSAALAGCGQCNDDPPPNDLARASLRAQALGWLNAELTAWSKVLDGASPQGRSTVVQTLHHWLIDSDLAGVRDPASLSRLPEGERNSWQALWKNVDALLKKAKG
jgi:serine/threonine-protein kinase